MIRTCERNDCYVAGLADGPSQDSRAFVATGVCQHSDCDNNYFFSASPGGEIWHVTGTKHEVRKAIKERNRHDARAADLESFSPPEADSQPNDNA